MNLSKHIPNSITSLNLLSGSIAVYFAFQKQFEVAAWLIMISAVFDFLDGFAARALNAYSDMGKELDSLADLISFGLAPAAIAFGMLQISGVAEWMAYLAFIIPVFSALRLAKFNIDTRQKNYFLGMPTPANAIFWAGAGMSYAQELAERNALLMFFVFFTSALLVTELPMFSLKFKSLAPMKNKPRYIFLSGCIALISVFGFSSLAWIIIWYIALNFLIITINHGPCCDDVEEEAEKQ